ncbi:MmcQ/YjbR family DNA-binding protein [Micrococcus luteus]
MDQDTLLRLTVERAAELPGTRLTHPFGPETDVHRVKDKLFMLHIDHDGRRLVNLKARPEDSHHLRAAHPEAVIPGYHMNKRHWISLRAHPDLDAQLVRDLVTESYLLVVEGMPRQARPVDPASFGV